MKSKLYSTNSAKAVAGAAMALTGLALSANAQQKQFATPKEAADSLVAAAETFNVSALKEILGPDSDDIVASDDTVGDKERAMQFAAKAKEKMSVGASAGVNSSLAII